ncbi:MAG: DUF1707 domain-containing protein [Gordonia sp. (in: high G+C Gram-positive bacteria)]|uniref:DUF1707 SHOCT-like domain-containing protein n=1 Tax=Gordonia sp. (in: high G+C Gram-positive bacteria) TaxID=84139 RepID=UPI0039E5E5C0
MTSSEPQHGKYYPAPIGNEQRAAIRASNADREEAHAFLSAAMSVGALTPEEYTDRAGTALAAVTLAELDALCVDLPMDRLTGAVAEVALNETRVSVSGAAPVTRAVAILSGSEISGGAVVGSSLRAFAFMGGVEIDLREVEFTAPVLEISCTAIMGGIRIVVPSDVTVEAHGSGIMGGFSGRAAGPGRAGAPRIVIRGFALMGGVDTERKARGEHDGPRLPN